MVGQYEDAMDDLFRPPPRRPPRRKQQKRRQKSDIELGMAGIQDMAAGVQNMAKMFGKGGSHDRLLAKAARLKKEEREHKAAEAARKTIKEIEQQQAARKKKEAEHAAEHAAQGAGAPDAARALAPLF